MQLTDIKVFQEYQGTHKGKWVLYNKETGKNLKTFCSWDTEEEARAAIPAAYETHKRNLRNHKAALAKQEDKRSRHEAHHSYGYENGSRYRTLADGGRVYDNLPGAVHYDSTGNGHYGTQIWDEA